MSVSSPSTRPIIDRLFTGSMTAQMGGSMINIPFGEAEWPVVTSNVTSGWVDGELTDIADPVPFQTTDRPMAPDHNLGIQMRISRKTFKQSGAAIEAAIRRDMNEAIRVELDKAHFLGTGANGQPLGIISGQASYGIATTAIDAAASYAAFRSAAVRFMLSNAASGLGSLNLMLRPELFDGMDDDLITGTAISEWDRLTARIPSTYMTNNALAAPAGGTPASTALMTTSAGGVAPFFVGLWGGVDLIRDPYSNATSGQLRLTAMVTSDVTVARPEQIEILTGLQ